MKSFFIINKAILAMLFIFGLFYFIFGWGMSGMRHDSPTFVSNILYYYDCGAPLVFFGFIFASVIFKFQSKVSVLAGILVHLVIAGWLFYQFKHTYDHNLEVILIQAEPISYRTDILFTITVVCASAIWIALMTLFQTQNHFRNKN